MSAVSIGAAAQKFFFQCGEFQKSPVKEQEECLERTAEELNKSIDSFKIDLYQRLPEKEKSDPNAYIEQILREENGSIIWNTSSKLVDVLSLKELYVSDRLKRVISKAAAAFWEINAIKLVLERRSFPLEYKEDILKKLNFVLDNLSEQEVETRFHIHCLFALMVKLQSREEEKVKILKAHAPKLLIKALEVIISGASGNINPMPLIESIVNLSFDVYNSIEESWYKDAWAISWMYCGHFITNLQDFSVLSDHIEGYKSDSKKAIFISNLCLKVIKNNKASEELRWNVYSEASHSLINLAKAYDPCEILGITVKKDSFWEVRYVSINNIVEAMNHVKPIGKTGYVDKALNILMDRCINEKKPPIIKIVTSALINFNIDIRISKIIQGLFDREEYQKRMEILKKNVYEQKQKTTQPTDTEIKKNLDEKEKSLKLLERMNKFRNESQPQGSILETKDLSVEEIEAIKSSKTIPDEKFNSLVDKTIKEYQELKVLEEKIENAQALKYLTDLESALKD